MFLNLDSTHGVRHPLDYGLTNPHAPDTQQVRHPDMVETLPPVEAPTDGKCSSCWRHAVTGK